MDTYGNNFFLNGCPSFDCFLSFMTLLIVLAFIRCEMCEHPKEEKDKIKVIIRVLLKRTVQLFDTEIAT
jgi:hypothetical protein